MRLRIGWVTQVGHRGPELVGPEKLDGVAPLMTDPITTNFTSLKKQTYIYIY